jgi:hypothetical protein
MLITIRPRLSDQFNPEAWNRTIDPRSANCYAYALGASELGRAEVGALAYSGYHHPKGSDTHLSYGSVEGLRALALMDGLIPVEESALSPHTMHTLAIMGSSVRLIALPSQDEPLISMESGFLHAMLLHPDLSMSEKRGQLPASAVTHRGQPLKLCNYWEHYQDEAALILSQIRAGGMDHMIEHSLGDFLLSLLSPNQKPLGHQAELMSVVNAGFFALPPEGLQISTP